MIIAEIGVNHWGNISYAREYLDELCASAVDAMTFQIREKAFYHQHLKYSGCVLPDNFYRDAVETAHQHQKKFGMAICDKEIIDLCEDWGVDFYKVLSKDFTREDFICDLLQTGKTVFLSTGTSGEDEIQQMVGRFGKWKESLKLIHTQISYDIRDVNLRAISRMREAYGIPVAFGNHCDILEVIYAAAAMDPSDLFIYAKGNRFVEHPDDKHAIPLSEVGVYVDKLKLLSLSLGLGYKEKKGVQIKGMV